jgi:hypothetical protein
MSKTMKDALLPAFIALLTGAGAAAGVSIFALGGVNAKIDNHTAAGTIHVEAASRISDLRTQFVEQVNRIETKAASAEISANVAAESAWRTQVMVEQLLKANGLTPAVPPPNPMLIKPASYKQPVVKP